MAEVAPNSQRALDNRAPYATSWEHLADELRRLDLLIHLQVLKHRNRKRANPLEPFNGLVLSKEEIAGLLADPGQLLPEENLASADDCEEQRLLESLDELESQIHARRAASDREEICLSLQCASRFYDEWHRKGRITWMLLAEAPFHLAILYA